MNGLDQLFFHGVALGILPVDIGFSLMSISQTMFAQRKLIFDGDLGEMERDFIDTAADVLDAVLGSLNHVTLRVESVKAIAERIGLTDLEFKVAVIEGTSASLAGYIDALENEPEIESALSRFNGHLEKLAAAMRETVADADGGAA